MKWLSVDVVANMVDLECDMWLWLLGTGETIKYCREVEARENENARIMWFKLIA